MTIDALTRTGDESERQEQPRSPGATTIRMGCWL